MINKTGGQIVCEGLLKQGVSTVFGIPGGCAPTHIHPKYARNTCG